MKTKEELIEYWINLALKGTNSKFRYLRNLSEYNYVARFYRKLFKSKVILERTRNKVFKQYLKDKKAGVAHFKIIRLVKLLDLAAEFVTRELYVTQEVLDEFKIYVLHNHFFKTIFGFQRSEEDLYDFMGRDHGVEANG